MGAFVRATTTPVDVELAPLLPAEPSQHAPSFMSFAGDGSALSDVAACEPCHADQVSEWRSSAHAWASFSNPWYRFAIDRFRADVGNEASNFCAGCHDPVLLAAGQMAGEVTPDLAGAHLGVPCLGCHGASGTTPDGNASLTLNTAAVPLPIDGDDATLEAHIGHLATDPERADALCVSCHRGLLGPETGNVHHLVGMDDATDWARSAWGGTGIERLDPGAEARGCVDCHMRRAEGVSHRFPGAHTLLSTASGDVPQHRAQAEMLTGAVALTIPGVHRADGTVAWTHIEPAPAPGAQLTFDVVIINRSVGHRFPGGTLDLQDAWVEVSIADSAGRVLAEAGTRHGGLEPDPTAHVLRAAPVDESGQLVWLHDVPRFETVAWNTTVPPRDARVVRYAVDLPERDTSAFVTIEARLRHRRHHAPYAGAVCEEAATERGRAFNSAVETPFEAPLDPCVAPPVVEIAAARVALGAPGAGPAPGWRFFYDYALGLSHGVQEELHRADAPIAAALEAAVSDEERAAALVLRAEVLGRQGRTSDSLAALDEAEALIGAHAAIAFRRGEALAAVWRWDAAAEGYSAAAAALPASDVAWQRAANALVSVGDFEAALAAAQTGLAIQPRDASLLLSQTMALEGLGAEADQVEAARDAYLRYRPYDGASARRAACFEDEEGCLLERQPIHTHEMRAEPGAE